MFLGLYYYRVLFFYFTCLQRQTPLLNSSRNSVNKSRIYFRQRLRIMPFYWQIASLRGMPFTSVFHSLNDALEPRWSYSLRVKSTDIIQALKHHNEYGTQGVPEAKENALFLSNHPRFLINNWKLWHYYLVSRLFSVCLCSCRLWQSGICTFFFISTNSLQHASSKIHTKLHISL